jgi:hypothetical protein
LPHAVKLGAVASNGGVKSLEAGVQAPHDAAPVSQKLLFEPTETHQQVVFGDARSALEIAGNGMYA